MASISLLPRTVALHSDRRSSNFKLLFLAYIGQARLQRRDSRNGFTRRLFFDPI